MHVDVVNSIVIARHIAEVSQYAADPDNAPLWYENIKSVEWKTPHPVQVGSRIDFVAHFLRRRLAHTYEVVEFVPGRHLMMRTPGPPFLMETTYTREDQNGATRMTIDDLLRYEWLPVEGREFVVRHEGATVNGVSIEAEVIFPVRS